jgi:starvation-inducible outer membrane lipoprotein
MKKETFNLTKLASLAMVLLLVGCAGVPPAVQRVEIPVLTSCVKSVPQRPAYEFDRLTPAATDGEIVLALARDWPRGRKYEAKLETILIGCM